MGPSDFEILYQVRETMYEFYNEMPGLFWDFDERAFIDAERTEWIDVIEEALENLTEVISRIFPYEFSYRSAYEH